MIDKRWAMLALLLSLTGGSALAGEYGAAARINGEQISAARLEGMFQEYLKEQGRTVQKMTSPGTYKRLRREALDLLIERELLWQEARKQDVASEDEVDEAFRAFREQFPDDARMRVRLEEYRFTAQSYREYLRQDASIRMYVARLAANADVTDAEVHAFYEENPDKMKRPESVRARHVLVQVGKDASEKERQAARKKIERVLAQARKGTDFAELARKHSQDESAARGGDLGFFPRGALVPPFEKAAFALEPGGISGVVETPFGFHIIKLEERRAEALVPEAEVRGQIRDYLLRVKRARIVQDRISELRDAAKIEIYGGL